jgi:hypothetical protein
MSGGCTRSLSRTAYDACDDRPQGIHEHETPSEERLLSEFMRVRCVYLLARREGDEAARFSVPRGEGAMAADDWRRGERSR